MRINHDAAEAHFAGYDTSSTVGYDKPEWCGHIDNCDVCSRPMDEEVYMIDGPAESSAQSMWGNLCVSCAVKTSPVIKWGSAQLYRRKGLKWFLVAGGPPQDNDC